MNRKQYKKLERENILRIQKIMDIRMEQIKQIYPYDWWEVSIKDETYKFLCQQLAQIKTNNMYPSMELSGKISEEDIKKLASGMLIPSEFLMK